MQNAFVIPSRHNQGCQVRTEEHTSATDSLIPPTTPVLSSYPCASGQTQSGPPTVQKLVGQRPALQMRNQSLCPVLSAESHHEPKRRTVHDRASTPQAHCPVASRSKDAHAERLRDPEPS